MVEDLQRVQTELRTVHACVSGHSVVSDSLQPHGLQLTKLLYPCGFSRQEYWNGLPCSPPGDLSNPEMEPRSPTLQVDSSPAELPGKPQEGSQHVQV